MSRLGYDLTQRVKDAIEVFKLNTKDYPQSANVGDSLGEAYLDDGKKELASRIFSVWSNLIRRMQARLRR